MSQRTIELVLKARNETSGALKALGADVASINGVANAAKTALAGIGVGLGAAQIVQFTQRVVDSASRIVDLSAKLNISTMALQEFKFAAEQSGTTIEEVGTAIRFLGKNISDAVAGNDALAASFVAVGLSVEDLSKLQLEDSFKAVMVALSGIESGNDRLRLSTELLGRSGSVILQMARDYDAQAKAAHDAGVVVDDLTLRKLESLGDQYGKVKQQAESFWMYEVVLIDKWTKAFVSKVQEPLKWYKSLLDEIGIPTTGGLYGSPGGSGSWGNPSLVAAARGGMNLNPLTFGVAPGAPSAPAAYQTYPPMGYGANDQFRYGDMGYGPAADWYKQQGSGGQWDMGMWGEQGGHAGVSEQIREAQAQAREYAAAMWDSADASAQMAENLRRAKSEAADQLASGMLNVFSILSGGNAKWVSELQRIYQLYLAIRAVLTALNVISMFSGGAGAVGGAAGGGVPIGDPISAGVAKVPIPGGMISPPPIGGGRGGTTIQMLIANPVSRMDALDLGRRTAEAAAEYDRRFM